MLFWLKYKADAKIAQNFTKKTQAKETELLQFQKFFEKGILFEMFF